MFSAFSLSAFADFIQNDVLPMQLRCLAMSQMRSGWLIPAFHAAMRLLQGDLSVILMPPSAASDFVRALQKAWRAGGTG